jgi:aminoglycoside 3-N-acetyltransferase
MVPGSYARIGGPITDIQLRAALVDLGLARHDIVLVHASMRRLGPVAGGAAAAVTALLDVVGPGGTLVVPTMTPNNCDPRRWPRTWGTQVPGRDLDLVRATMPGFDPLRTPSSGMGVLAETVRTWPGAVRSAHPQTSFAAVGRSAGELTADHAVDCHLGEESVLGRLYEAGDAKILLVGVGYEKCTAFHLGEYHWPGNAPRDYECVLRADGRDRWFHYQDVTLDDGDFAAVGAALESGPEAGLVRRGRVGSADCRLLPLATAVDFATGWFSRNRIPLVAGRSPQPGR